MWRQLQHEYRTSKTAISSTDWLRKSLFEPCCTVVHETPSRHSYESARIKKNTMKSQKKCKIEKKNLNTPPNVHRHRLVFNFWNDYPLLWVAEFYRSFLWWDCSSYPKCVGKSSLQNNLWRPSEKLSRWQKSCENTILISTKSDA